MKNLMKKFNLLLTLIGTMFLFSVVAQASTYTVTNTNDSGAGSLRQAITDANSQLGADVINFNIGGGGVQTISPGSALPTITEPLTIDGTTQPGYAGTPIIELNGSNAGASANGLTISAGSSTVKGLVINGFSAYGIVLTVKGQNVISGNYFGLDTAGINSLPIGGVSLYVVTSGNTIGGTTPAARNVVSGVGNCGIYFEGSEATANVVQGNYIGTNATGAAAIGNITGITFDNASDNTIGGTMPAQRNLISGNNGGIWIVGANSARNAVTGNYIGTKADGTSNLTNGFYGIFIGSGAHSNFIGGTHPNEGNVIAFQTREVALEADAGSGNSIRGNSIFSTGQIAIDLGNDAETPNDPGDANPGANDLQNYPVITSAAAANGNVDIVGTLNSASNKQFAIDLYCNATLNGQGKSADAKTYLTTVLTITDGSGNANFNTSVPVASLTGKYLSATATNDGSSTSELSLPIQATGLNGMLQFSTANYSVNENGGSATITVTRTGGSIGVVSVSYTTSDGTAKQPGDYTGVAGNLFWADGDTSDKTFAVKINDDSIPEPNETINLTLSNPAGGATLGGQSSAVLTINDNEPPLNPADLVVTNTNDTGSGSLRQAILASNSLAGKDTITFNIQPSGSHTITPLSALPDVTDPVIIDGTTQPGFAGNPIVEIDGTSSGASVNGLVITAGNSTVKGLVINRFKDGGGILLKGNDSNVVSGNYIGTNVAGTVAQGNFAGILAYSSNNLIGGTTPAARNVISGNGKGSGVGIDKFQSSASGNIVQGNYIGTNAAGTAALANGFGVFVLSASDNLIGGSTPAARNLISGNGEGVLIARAAPDISSNNKVQGNYIGTQADGTTALKNDFTGVHIAGGLQNMIGGTAPGEGNIIAFNGPNIGNAGYGVCIEFGGFSSNNGILGNSIFANKGLGIDLGCNGVTSNDQGDVDTGSNTANEYQNFPVLTSAIPNGANTDIKGTLNSLGNTQFKLEFFSNAASDSSGFGEGQTLLGTATVNTDASGDASFTFTVPTASIAGQFLSATATDPNNNTSEFSLTLSMGGGTPGSLQFSATSYNFTEGGGNGLVTVTRTGGSTGSVNVNYATSDGAGTIKATAPDDYTATSGTLSFADGQTSRVISIPIIDDNISEALENFSITLSKPTNGATLGVQQSALLFISDNDFSTVSVSDVSQAEGNSGTTNFNFNVTLSAASGQTVTVNYATGDGTATLSDYQPNNGTLTFNPGETSKTFSVSVNGDTTNEPDENFFVKLSNPTNATIAKAQGTGTIINDDAPAAPTLDFSQANYGVAEQLGTVTVTVTRNGDSSGSASVDYATADGTAIQKSDFEITAGTLNFAPGEVSKTISVLINQDSYVEGPESFNLVLSNPSGAALGQSTTTVTITDDAFESLTNPIDDPQSFVYMHYHDFLNREPDQAGLQFWTNEIASCGQDAACIATKRTNVSAAFFLSIEFQQTGYLLYLFQKESFASLPKYNSFMRDLQEVSQGVVVNSPGWDQKLAANQQQLAQEWVDRPSFKTAYDAMSNADYVNALYANAGVVPPQAERDGLVTKLDTASTSRAAALLDVAANVTFRQQEQNSAFVLMQYFGYLRRDPDSGPDSDLSGYYFWLNKLNAFNGDYQQAEMVKAFITSGEYRARFGLQ